MPRLGRQHIFGELLRHLLVSDVLTHRLVLVFARNKLGPHRRRVERIAVPEADGPPGEG